MRLATKKGFSLKQMGCESTRDSSLSSDKFRVVAESRLPSWEENKLGEDAASASGFAGGLKVKPRGSNGAPYWACRGTSMGVGGLREGEN